MDGIINVVIQVVRWLGWTVTTVLLQLADMLYAAIESVATYDFITNQNVFQKYFTIFIEAFLGFFIVFRLMKRYLKSIVNEQEAQSLNPIDLLLKIGSMAVLVGILPILLTGFGNLQRDLIKSISNGKDYFITDSSGKEVNDSFSTLILEQMVGVDNAFNDICETKPELNGTYLTCKLNQKGIEKYQKEEFEKKAKASADGYSLYRRYHNWRNVKIDDQPILNLYDLDINYQSVEGTYDILDNWADFAIVFLAGLASSFLIFLIGLQIAGRFLSLILKLIIAPYSISSIIEGNDENFKTWWRLFISDFIANYLQMLLLIIVTRLFININVFDITSSNVDNITLTLNGIAKIVIYIGALLGVLNAPSGVAQLIGSDIGTQTALQGMQTLMMGSRLLGAGGRIATNIGATGVAGAIYGTGRLLGGKSFDEIRYGNSSNSISNIINEGFNDPTKNNNKVSINSPTTRTNPDTVANSIATKANQSFKEGPGSARYNAGVAAAKFACFVGSVSYGLAGRRFRRW